MEEVNLTRKVWSEGKDFIKTPMFPRIPWRDRCCSIWCRQVESYAFSRSKKTDNTDSWRANANVINVSTLASAEVGNLWHQCQTWYAEGLSMA